MDKRLKKKWVAALRSGDYEQGDGALRTAESQFCCLGVLCDIVDQYGWEWRENPATSTGGQFVYELGGDMRSSYLPTGLKNLAGIPLNKETALASLNDRGESFEQIADYIERNL